MKQLIHLKATLIHCVFRCALLPRGSTLILFVLANVALLGQVKAVDPSDTFYGLGAFNGSSTGLFDSAFGYNALHGDTTGSFNTAIGEEALYSDTTGSNNTAIGDSALYKNISGYSNTAIGELALYFNTAGHQNTATGNDALYTNTIGYYNTATGGSALLSNTIGANNTATGVTALVSNTTGTYNTADGVNALYNNTTGASNIAIGANAGKNLTTGSGNVCIGVNVLGLPGESNTIRIGSTQTATYIAGIYGTNEGGTLAVVTINSNGRLGTQLPMVSSRRFKKEIKPMENASEAILALKPVTFQFKNDTKGVPQFGLIAEEVEKVNPDLVTRDEEGKPYTVRYDQVNSMLLNEFLKEHRKVQEQGAIIAKQQKQIEALAAGLQKVSDQVEASKGAPQVMASNTQ